MGGGDEDFMRDLEARAKRCKWYEQLQTFLPLQTLFSFSVPRVICIGEESSGKSSTLERLAELSIFPTDRKLCTRMPIELRLRHQSESRIREFLKDDRASSYVMMQLERGAFSKLPMDMKDGPFTAAEVASKVKEWMESIVHSENGELSGVTDNRLIIELYSTRRLNLDLIDLPGIVAGHTKGEPSNMMEQTRRLTEKYLKMEHTLILLVVSNRAERIRNSQAFELVQRHHKEKQTIGVLTMVDRCSDHRNHNDPFWELKERLEGLSDDLPELAGGYIALKNRDTTCQEMTIQSANAEELDWFQTHLSNLNEETKSCLGMGNLVSKLLLMLQLYTEETWSVAEHKRLSNKLQSVEQQLNAYGERYTGDLTFLLSSDPLNKARAEAERMPVFDNVIDTIEQTIKAYRDANAERNNADAKASRQIPQKLCELKAKILLDFENLFKEVLKLCIYDPLNGIIQDLKTKGEPPFQLNRFTLLHNGLKSVCEKWAEELSDALWARFRSWLYADVMHWCYDKNSCRSCILCLRKDPLYFVQNIYNLLGDTMCDLIMTALLCSRLDQLLEPVTLTSELQKWWMKQLEKGENIAEDEVSPLCKEDPTYVAKRKKHQEEKAALQDMINELERVFRDRIVSQTNNTFGFNSFVFGQYPYEKKSPFKHK